MQLKSFVVALLSLLSAVDSARAQAPAAEFEAAIEASLDSVYMLGIARRGGAGPEVFQFVGTGWVIAEGKLATNAHVAEALLEGSLEGRLVGKRSWSDRDELALSASSIRIHPAYGPWNARLKRVIVRNENDPNAARTMSFIPIADVAIIEVEAGNTGKPLVLADPQSVEPALSEAVVYLGFPHENISGFPTLHAVPGHVTAKTDFFFQRAPWADSYLIHYGGTVVGGASGSPLLNRAGQVIGLISAAEHNFSDGVRTSFGFAYGQRADLAKELLNDDYAAVQARRDGVWSQRLTHLLIPPDELLEQIANDQGTRDGVERMTANNTVTRRQMVVKQDESAKLQVTIEPGMRYGFLAAAHDGSDVDAQVVARETDEVLGVDVKGDYFPVVWIGPLDQRCAVTFEVAASEKLLQDTPCSLHVYKFEPRIVAVDGETKDEGNFFVTTHVTSTEGASVATWRFQVAAGAQLLFSGESADLYDIDLLLALDGTVVASDESLDALPMVIWTAPNAGTLEVRLRIPDGIPSGAEFTVKGFLFAGEKPTALDGAPAPTEDELWSREEIFAFIDQLLDVIWKDTGSIGETIAEDVGALDGQVELEFDVPAGALPVFIAVAPHGEDIDLQILSGGEVVAQDVAGDATPLVAIAAADVDRKVTLRIVENLADAKVEQVAFRYALVRQK